MSELATPMNYINYILQFLKGNSSIKSLFNNEITKEYELDLTSSDLYKNLFNNMIYFDIHNKNDKIISEEQNYFYSQIINILDIIHESAPSNFLESDFIQSLLIYIIYSFNTPFKINLEFVIKKFLGFANILQGISNKRIVNTVNEFESKIVQTIDTLINKYIMDFQPVIDFDFSNIKNNFNDKINNLAKYMENLPLYLQGFIKYSQQLNSKKFLLIKIYEFIEIINPYKNNNNNMFSKLYQGYALYEILTHENIPFINFKAFNQIKKNRIENNDAKSILELVIQILQKRSHADFVNAIKEKNIKNLILYSPKILDIFDITDEYYKDLYNQLNYYLSQYLPRNISCTIINVGIQRILWLNFCKILLLYLSNEDIKKREIKIIFYLIVNLFNPNIDTKSLEFRDDAISMLFSQCRFSGDIIDNQEIYQFVDKQYSDYYVKFNTENKFNQMFIDLKNKEILEDQTIIMLKSQEGKKYEIENITKCINFLPFPLLEDYLKSINLEVDIQNSLSSNKLLNFYKICFVDFDLNDSQCDAFLEDIKKAKMSSKTGIDIKGILEDTTFVNLIKEIMKSPVMKDAYNRISLSYLTNGKFDLNKKKVEDSDINNARNSNYNLINKKSLFDYYDEFCGSLFKLDYSNRFIVMALPETIKGFTFRFLKIVINSEGIKFERVNNNKLILLKAYLIFVIIHELNHFLKRYFNINEPNDLCHSPKISGFDDEGEGGKQLIKLLFGDEWFKY